MEINGDQWLPGTAENIFKHVKDAMLSMNDL